MGFPLFLILVDGPMGSGKTTTTKLLSEKLPDAARIAFPDIKRLVPNYKENEKTLPVIREVMRVMIDKYLEFGVSVIVEHITKAEGVQILKDLAEQREAKFMAYRLSAPKDVRMIRVCERARQMMNVPELPESKVAELTGYFESNDQFYTSNPSDLISIINTEELNPDQVAETIVHRIS